MMSHVNEMPALNAVSDELQNNAVNLTYETISHGTCFIRRSDNVSSHVSKYRLNYLRSCGLAISASTPKHARSVPYPSQASMLNSDGVILSSLHVVLRATLLVILMMLSLVLTSILFANLPGNGWTI